MKLDNFPIEPLYDNVYVQKDSEATTTSGLFMPQSVKGRAQTGVVLAVGPGHLDVASGEYRGLGLKPGDRVFVKEFDGYIMRYGEWEFHVFRGNELIGKVV